MKMRFDRVVAAGLFILALGSGSRSVQAEENPDSTLRVPSFDLPASEFLSAASQLVLKKQIRELEALNKTCPIDISNPRAMVAGRRCREENYYPGVAARLKARYPVSIQSRVIAGVPTEVITPAAGVSPANERRVLIYLHDGAFIFGGRWRGELGAIPISAVGKFRVLSVDYRMAPEFKFPAASEDVATVYREVLKTYGPENIGIYGCSAGGLLTAQAIAWFQRERLPPPGAIGMFCAAGSYYGEGDSGPFIAALTGFPIDQLASAHADPYLQDTTANDPLVFPVRSDAVLVKFPPSLLIASTRDQALSSVAYMHSRLVALGVEADLHVWEGLGHGFFLEPDLPESREVYGVVARFFDRHLGGPARATEAPSRRQTERQ